MVEDAGELDAGRIVTAELQRRERRAALDDPVTLQRAAQIVRAALARQREQPPVVPVPDTDTDEIGGEPD